MFNALFARKVRSMMYRVPPGGMMVLAVFILAGLFGSHLLIQSHAATPVLSVEAESGTASATTSGSVTDGTASAGKAVKFGAGTSGGTRSNNCAPNPHLCGYPDATNTGPTTTPTKTVAGLDITTAGTYSGYIVNGCVTIEASNVTFTQSIVNATNGCNAVVQIPPSSNATNVVVDHVEIDAAHAIDSDNHDMAGITGSDYTATYLNIHGGGDGIDVGDNTIIEDNYVHDQWIDSNPGGPPHVDGLQSAGSLNLTIRHNTLDNSSGNDSPIILGADLGDITNAVVSDNLLIAATNEPSLRAGHNSGSAYRAKGIQFLNNRFSYINSNSYTYNFLPDGTNPILFSGNVSDADGSAIPNYNSAGNGTSTYGY